MTPIIIPAPFHSCCSYSGPIPWYGCLVLTPVFLGFAFLTGWLLYIVLNEDDGFLPLPAKIAITLILIPLIFACIGISVAVWF